MFLHVRIYIKLYYVVAYQLWNYVDIYTYMIGTLLSFICSCKPNTLGPIFFTVLKMFWAEQMYTFQESVEVAVTMMLQTFSSFHESVGLTAFPREILDKEIVMTLIFVSSLSFGGQPLIGRIGFIHFNGTQLGIGTVGAQN